MEYDEFMCANIQAAEFMRSMVSVSRFNKGEAAKIFDKVSKTGITQADIDAAEDVDVE